MDKQLVGLAVFVAALLAAATLYIIDRYKRVDLSLPWGRTIPYSLAVLGAGVYYYSAEGVLGLSKALASAVFIGAVMSVVDELKTQS